jgi:eukaryotic-like serine/threonine-protein kinase
MRFRGRRSAEAPTQVIEEEEVVPARPRPPTLWPWLLLLLLLVAGGLAAAYYFTRDDDDKPDEAVAVTIPNVVGQKQEVAVRRLNERELVPRIVTRASQAPKGTVFGENPGAGTEVARESPVTLLVSATEVTSVPNVVGAKSAVAVNRLKAAGLNAQLTSVPSPKAAGTVTAQNPAAGASVGKGSTVGLRVSKGATTVPDVVGQDASTARTALRSAGLVPVVFQVPGAEPKGTVTAQKPMSGKKAPRGSKVRINVSTGSQTSPPPPSGTTTTRAAATVKVPDVVGEDQATATSTLRGAGFTVRMITVPTDDETRDGTVQEEQPAGGRRAPEGSQVTIYVFEFSG